MVTGPALMPFKVGVPPTKGTVEPCGIYTFVCDRLAFEPSLTARLMNTPPAPAAVPNVTGNEIEPPGATVRLDARMIPVGAVTVT